MTRNRRSGILLTSSSALILLLLAAVVVFQVISQGNTAAADEQPEIECATTQHFFAFDPNKETPNAFGPEVTQKQIGEQRAELRSRRCQDPALTASHLHGWQLITLDQINDEAHRLAADPAAWTQAIETMEALETASAATNTFVPARTKSLYMVDEAGWPMVYEGYTVYDGFALKFTHPDGRTVEWKLNCGFQPIWRGFPPPPCEGECITIPPPPPPPCEENCSPPPSDDKDPTESTMANPAVDDWKKDGGPTHTVTYGDGATDPRGLQTDPGADAAAAEAAAEQATQEQEQEHQDAVEDATVVDTEEHGAATPPATSSPDW